MASGIEIAVRVVEVDLIEKVEELRAELNTLRFAKWKAPDDREVNVSLSWPAQNVAADIADVRAFRARQCISI